MLFSTSSPLRGLEPFEKMEKRMPKEKLYLLCVYEPLMAWVRKSDYAFYQALVEVLIPDVLRPIPSEFVLIFVTVTNYYI